MRFVSDTLAVDVLQRILMPRKGEPHDVRMLYLLEGELNKARVTWPDRTTLAVPEGAEVSLQTLSLIHI